MEQTPFGGGEDVGQLEVDPAASRNGDTFASGANEAIPQTDHRALPGGSARGRSCRGRDLGLNDDQGGSGAIDCQGHGAVGHRELGSREKADCRQAIGS